MIRAAEREQPLSARELLLEFVPIGLTIDEPLSRMETLLKEEDFDSDYKIIAQGGRGDKMYLLSSGEVQVRRWKIPGMGTPEDLAILRQGAIFGEIALALDIPRTADVIALTAVRTFSLSRDDWQHIKAFFPAFAVKIEEIAKSRAGLVR